MKAYLVKIVKNLFVLGFRLPPLCLGSFSPSLLSLFPAGLDCSGLLKKGDVLPTLVYSCFFLLACFGQSIGQTPRYGLDGVITFFFTAGAWSRPIRLIWTPMFLRVTSSTAIYFYSAKWSLLRPFLSIWVIICDHFHAQSFRIHRWQSCTYLWFALPRRHHHFFRRIDKNFSFFFPFVTVYLVNPACDRPFEKLWFTVFKANEYSSLLFRIRSLSVGSLWLVTSLSLIETGQADFLLKRRTKNTW